MPRPCWSLTCSSSVSGGGTVVDVSEVSVMEGCIRSGETAMREREESYVRSHGFGMLI